MLIMSNVLSGGDDMITRQTQLTIKVLLGSAQTSEMSCRMPPLEFQELMSQLWKICIWGFIQLGDSLEDAQCNGVLLVPLTQCLRVSRPFSWTSKKIRPSVFFIRAKALHHCPSIKVCTCMQFGSCKSDPHASPFCGLAWQRPVQRHQRA